MSDPIDAIYDGGVLKPLVPLALPDKTHVTVTVVAAESTSAESELAVAGFDRDLAPLLFDGPSLPADFSRADIYSDHD